MKLLKGKIAIVTGEAQCEPELKEIIRQLWLNSIGPAVLNDIGQQPSETVEKILFLLDFCCDLPSGGFFSNGEPVAW